jgi:hypothetical protein
LVFDLVDVQFPVDCLEPCCNRLLILENLGLRVCVQGLGFRVEDPCTSTSPTCSNLSTNAALHRMEKRTFILALSSVWICVSKFIFIMSSSSKFFSYIFWRL